MAQSFWDYRSRIFWNIRLESILLFTPVGFMLKSVFDDLTLLFCWLLRKVLTFLLSVTVDIIMLSSVIVLLLV